MTKITRDDIEVFTKGDCHVLAMALCKQSGYPVYAFLDKTEEFEPDIHAFVKLPDGNYLDVTGVNSGQQLRENWEWWMHELGKPEDFVIGPVWEHGDFERLGWGDLCWLAEGADVWDRAEEVATHLLSLLE